MKTVTGITIKSKTYLNEYQEVIDYYHKQNSILIFTKYNKTLVYQNKFVLFESSLKSKISNFVEVELHSINQALKFLKENNLTKNEIFVFSDNEWLVEWCFNKPLWYSKNKEKAYHTQFLILRSYMSQFKAKINGFLIPTDIRNKVFESAEKI